MLVLSTAREEDAALSAMATPARDLSETAPCPCGRNAGSMHGRRLEEMAQRPERHLDSAHGRPELR